MPTSFSSRHRKRLLLIAFCLAIPLTAFALPPTPLEAQGYTRISSSAELSDYMHVLAANDPRARIEIIGHSVQGRPIEALIFSARQRTSYRPLKMLLVGSQHGASEPATGEALIAVARDLSLAARPNVLDSIEVILIPNANPDGRDLGRRKNANGVNINVDFVAMTQPETRALKAALIRLQPDVILDSHESAVLKRQSLAREGYMTDFNAQFESANHPATPSALLRLAYRELLPELIRRVSAKDLPANRYIGEIISIKQPITNGGLSLKNFRNMAGVSGRLSFLVETKLDNTDYAYPSYRNIKERLNRQLLCIQTFIDVIHEHQDAILMQMNAAHPSPSLETISLRARYVADPEHPYQQIPLRRLDTGEIEILTFADHDRVEPAYVTPLPRALAITDHLPEMARLLDSQFILYTRLQSPQTVTAEINRYAWAKNPLDGALLLTSTSRQIHLKPGALQVDLSQPQGRVAMLLLDPRSSSTVFMHPEYKPMLDRSKAFFIHSMM